MLLGTAAAAALLVGLALAVSEGWQLVIAAVAVVAAPVVLYVLFADENSWPYLLIIAIHISLFGSPLSVGNIHIRPNMVVAVLICFLLLARLAANRVRWRTVPLLSLLLATNGVYLLSTLVNRSNPFFVKGVADCILFFVNVSQYLIIVWFFATDRKMFEAGMRLLLYCSTAFSAVYVVAFVLAEMGMQAVSNFLTVFAGENDTSFARVGNLGTTEGTYLAFSVIVLLGMLLLFRHNLPWKPRWTVVMLAANGGALALTFARGPWLAAVAGFALVCTFAMVRFPMRALIAGVVQSLLVLVLLISAFAWYITSKGDVMEMFAGRIEAMSAVEAGTVADRVLLWTRMLQDVPNAPILGHGAHNYAKFRDDPATQISENFVLELLHSAGVAVVIFLFANFLAAIRALKCVWRWQDAQRIPWLLPLLGGFTAMFLSSLSNPGMTGGFYWAALGLLVSGSQLAVLPITATTPS